MFCKTCGKPLDDGTARCPFCGETFTATPARPEPAPPGPPPHGPEPLPAPPPGLKKRAYYKRFSRRRGLITTAAVLCYVCAAITLLSGLLGPLGLWALIDVFILLGLGLGVHLFRSRVCAILLTLYAAYTVIYTLVESGMPAGWLGLVAAGFAIAGTFGFSGEWRHYCADSVKPAEDTGDAV